MAVKIRTKAAVRIKVAHCTLLKGNLIAETWPPRLISPECPFFIHVRLQLDGPPNIRLTGLVPVHVTGVYAHGEHEEISLHVRGGERHHFGPRRALKLCVGYKESSSLHQNRAFALKIEIDAAYARRTFLKVAPLLLGPTMVVQESTVEEDGFAFSHTVTTDSAADARQRRAEERGEVCDLTGEEAEDGPATKKLRVVHEVD